MRSYIDHLIFSERQIVIFTGYLGGQVRHVHLPSSMVNSSTQPFYSSSYRFVFQPQHVTHRYAGAMTLSVFCFFIPCKFYYKLHLLTILSVTLGISPPSSAVYHTAQAHIPHLRSLFLPSHAISRSIFPRDSSFRISYTAVHPPPSFLLPLCR
jgi:hypothetical protein